MSGSRSREILPLTGLRALAAWWVVGFHFVRALLAPGLLARGVSAGHLAVDVFFVLSGFVLAERYREADVACRPALRAFAARRFARIYPLYVLSLAVGFAAAWPRSLEALATPRGAIRMVLQLALLNSWSHVAMFHLNWAAWSLSVEAFLYALFPFLLRRLQGRSPRSLYIVIVACWSLTFVAPAVYGVWDPDGLHRSVVLGDEVLWSWYLKFFPVLRIPEFVAGVAAALLPVGARRRGLAWIGGGVLIGAGLWGALPYAYLQSGVMLPAVVAVVLGLAAPRPSILGTTPVVTLGHASYATYILHVPVFLLAARFAPSLWESLPAVMAYGALLLALSLFAHRAVEEPLRRWISRRLIKRELVVRP